ncbi:MAG TPA: hypothetical protein VM925_29400, partial [Labilithrix sp.]|nr:hypothetical protein [Labilithrix sp.]
MRSLGAVTVLALLAAACRPSGSGVRSAEMGSFRAASAPAEADPTIRSARLLPETVDDTTANYGSEPGGGLRVIAAGLRLVTSSKGALVAAEDRFPQSPTSTTVLPERLGGGFLFLIGNTIWRADRWLGPAKPIFTSPQQVQAIVPGLDRLYIRAQNVVLAIDGRTGESLDLGPWPASPYVASYGAADGWRAAAVTDMRGVVATFDAGATWRALDLAMDPKQVVVSNDSLAIGGFENGRTEAWYEVRPDGSIARLGAAPHDVKLKLAAPTTSRTTTYGGSPTAGGIVISTAKAPVHGTTTTVLAAPDPRPAAEPDKEDVAAKIFGKRPLAAAIEDGWPLADGTAVIARDGALARVNLTDGTLIELVRDAFPLKPARCHPITLTRPTAIGAFGFVCGEPRGATILYAYEPLRGRLAELKRFDKPRVVTSSGNGALAIRGPCAEDGEPVPSPRPEPVKLEKSKDGKDDDAASTEKTKSKADAKASVRAKEVPPPEAKAADAKALSAPSSEVHPYCVLGHDGAWKEIHVRGDVGGERVVVLADGRIVVVSPPEALGTPGRITLLDKGRATTAPITFPRVPTDVGRVLRLGFWLDGFEERRPGVVGGWIEAGGVMLGVEIKLDGKATPGQLVRDAGMPFVSGKYGLGWTASRRGYETTDGGMTWTSIDLPDPLVPIGRVERRACGPIGCLAQGWLRIGWGGPKQGAAPPPSPPVRPTTANLPVPRVQLACEPVASMPPQVPTAKAKPAASTTPAHPPRFG